MRKIPTRNYIVYGLICILTFVLLISWVNTYNKNKTYDNTNERMDFLKEIKESEIKSFLDENTDMAIYLSNSEDTNNQELEKKLRKKLIKKDYTSDIFYVNTINLSDNVLKLINEKYQVSFENLPNLIVVSDGSIVDTYYISETAKAEDIVTILEEYYD